MIKVSFDVYRSVLRIRPTLVGVAGLVICLNSQEVSLVVPFDRYRSLLHVIRFLL